MKTHLGAHYGYPFFFPLLGCLAYEVAREFSAGGVPREVNVDGSL